MKKLLGVVIAAVLLLCMLPISAMAAGEEVRYSIDGGASWKSDSLMNALWNTYGQKSVKIELLRDITLDSSWYSQQDLLYGENVVFELDGKGYTIHRGSCDCMLFCVRGENSIATLKNITIDGGAIWSSADPLNRINTGTKPRYSNSNLIYVDGGATLILDSGAILQNNDLGSNNYGAAVVVGYSDSGNGKMIMKDGAIIRNNCSASGGGVCVMYSGDEFEMQGGEISGNYASDGGGGGVFVNAGIFTMKNGSISGNASSNNGGGVCARGSFIMEDGIIHNNSTSVGGGGITVLGGSVTLKGGSVKNNSITGAMGGGVLLNSGSLSVSGVPSVIGNTANGSDNNIYLNSGKVINVVGPLGSGASLGVTTKTVPAENAPVNVTGNNDTNYMSCFSSDSPLYNVANSAANVVQLSYAEVYTVSVANAAGGSIRVSSDRAAAGKTVKLLAEPNSGYKMQNITVKDAFGNEIPVDDGKFTMPASNVTIMATFEKAKIPSTGDGANFALWMGMLAISAIGVVTLSRKARKEY